MANKAMIEKLKNNFVIFGKLEKEAQGFLKSLPPNTVQALAVSGCGIEWFEIKDTEWNWGRVYQIKADYLPEPEAEFKKLNEEIQAAAGLVSGTRANDPHRLLACIADLTRITSDCMMEAE